MKKLTARVGKLSEVGFLQNDQKLKKVIKDDKRFLKSNNLIFHDVAQCLEIIHYKCVEMDRNSPNEDYETKNWHKVDTNISVAYDLIQTMGSQVCPFLKNGKSCSDTGKMFTIRNDITNDEIRLNYLIIHMIKRHHFCEGPDTPYRFDIEKAIFDTI